MVCLVFTAVLAVAMAVWESPPDALDKQNGQSIYVTGRVYQKEIKNDKSVIYLDDAAMAADSAHISKEEQVQIGKVICYMKGTGAGAQKMPEMGSYVCAYGELFLWEEPSNPGEFDIRRYYELSGIKCAIQNAAIIEQAEEYSRFREGLYRIRKRCAAVYEASMEAKEASIMKAMVLGDKTEMDTDIKKLYQHAGIAHVLAISGLHISLLGMGIYKGLRRAGCPIPVAAVMGLLFIVLYSIMTGFSPSSFRAVCMFALHLLAEVTGRTYDMLTALAVAAMLLLIQEPAYLYHTGFQFSFGAILGIGYLAPIIQMFCPVRGRYIRQKEQDTMLRTVTCTGVKLWNAFSVSLGVFLFTLPIQLSSYYGVNVYSVFLNLLIIPCMSVILYAGGVGLAVGLWSVRAGSVILTICHVLLQLYEQSSGRVLSLPGSTWITGAPAKWQIVSYYSLLFLGIYSMKMNRKNSVKKGQMLKLQKRSVSQNCAESKIHDPVYRCYLLCGCCFLSAFLILTLSPKSHTAITLLDVGQGDGSVIQSESGHTYLIDGGSSSNQKLAEYTLIPYLKYNGIDTIDCAFISHLDEDHYNGIAELLVSGREEGITVKAVILSEAEVQDEKYTELCALAGANKTAVYHMKQGDSVTDGELQISCLYPQNDTSVSDRNEASLVLSVTYESFQGLFMGDLGMENEKKVIQAWSAQGEKGGYCLLKAGHHGSKDSSGEDFLTCIQPDITVISCGEHNRYGHPHGETLERLRQAESRIYQTPETGAVTLWIENGKIHMETYKQ